MKWIGGENLRIESVQAVSRVMLRTDSHKRYAPDRKIHCFCFKLSGASLHTSGPDAVLCETNTLLYIPRGIDYYVDVIELGPSIAVDFHLAEGCTYEKRLKLMRPSDPVQMRQIFEEMYACSAGVRPGDSYALMGRLYQLMGLVEDQLSGEEPAAGFAKIEPALICIRENLSDPTLSEPMLAGLCGYSTGYFRRVFTAAMGKPPVRYITEKRMERAVSMLESGLSSISDIAAEVGYSNVYYFSTAFKKYYGEPPMEWTRRDNGGK